MTRKTISHNHQQQYKQWQATDH